MNDFWARRKAAVKAEEEAEADRGIAAKEAETRAKLETKSDTEILKELNLPNPDDMDAGDDFSAFLKTTVPERIRIRALRRLWTTNPVLANLDGLVEYGEDFTDAATVVENLQTAYRVGQGMLGHIQKLALADAENETENPEETRDEAEAVESGFDTPPERKPDNRSDRPSDSDSTVATLNSDNFSRVKMVQFDKEAESYPQLSADSEKIIPSKPRRMRYSFDD